MSGGVPYIRYVYFLKSGEFIKVGRTRDLDRRKRQIQTGSPLECLYIGFVRFTGCQASCDAGLVERTIHKILKPFRAHGEWFKPDGIGRVTDLVCLPIIDAEIALQNASIFWVNSKGDFDVVNNPYSRAGA